MNSNYTAAEIAQMNANDARRTTLSLEKRVALLEAKVETLLKKLKALESDPKDE